MCSAGSRKKKITRRDFIKKTISGSGIVLFGLNRINSAFGKKLKSFGGSAQVYVVKNGTPEKNLEKLIDMLGGIESIISPDDIVILKPNCQWWNQGTTNISVMKKLIEMVLDISGFNGEVIVAENHQKPTPYSRGWIKDNKINGDPEANNMGELIELFQGRGYSNVTKYHWLNTENGGKIVSGPSEGDGYVMTGPEYEYEGRKTLMTYPVFTSSYSGITIDLKSGAWQNGNYINRKVKLINMAGLNHHFFGVTSSVKNIMGIVELPGNDTGWLVDKEYYNFHGIIYEDANNIDVRAMGGALGTFMRETRKPDLNIVTAEWVGWGSRTEPEQAVQVHTLLGGVDPVALDYYGAKYVLWPHTPEDYDHYSYHDPDRTDRPFRQYLEECAKEGGGIIDEKDIQAHVYDFEQSFIDEQRYTTGSYELSIGQNYPNPFSNKTTIPFNIKNAGVVSLIIYNIRGREVKRLINKKNFSYGDYLVEWDGRDEYGRKAAPGGYLCRIISGRKKYTIKIFRTKF